MLGSTFGLVAERFPQHNLVWVRLYALTRAIWTEQRLGFRCEERLVTVLKQSINVTAGVYICIWTGGRATPPTDPQPQHQHKLVWVRIRFNKSHLNWAKTSVRLRRKASGSSATVNQRYGGVASISVLYCWSCQSQRGESKYKYFFWAADSSNWFT